MLNRLLSDLREVFKEITNLDQDITKDMVIRGNLETKEGITNLGLSSMDLVELVIILEQKYDIVIDNEETLAATRNIETLINFLQEKIAAKEEREKKIQDIKGKLFDDAD